jgi:hypothetical protein
LNQRSDCKSSTESKRALRALSRRSKSIAPIAPHAATHARWSLQRSRSTWRFHEIACSGHADTQAPHRVHRSRSIGFSCDHSASKAPSQPLKRVIRPDRTGNARADGNSPSRATSVASTVTESVGASASAQRSAASSGPTISNWPDDS